MSASRAPDLPPRPAGRPTPEKPGTPSTPGTPGTGTAAPSADVPALRPPPGRYGPPPTARRRRLARLGMGALGALAVVVAVWIGVGTGTAEVTWDDVGYSVRGPDRVDVTFRVVKDPGATARCTVTALSTSYAEVGVVDVTVGPADARTVEQTATVATQELAVTGVVDGCEIVADAP